MIIMVTGGRHYWAESVVADALAEFNAPGNVLLVGGAKGADEVARKVWHYEFERPYVVVPAAWSRSSRAAGHARNHLMVTGNALAPHAVLSPGLVLAFPGGVGTADAVKRAETYGIEVRRVQ